MKKKLVVIYRCPDCDPQETYWGFYYPESDEERDWPKCELCKADLCEDYSYEQMEK